MGVHRWLRRLILLFVGCVVGLMAAEAVARQIAPAGKNQMLFPNVDLYPRDLYVEIDGMSFPNPRFSGDIRSLDYSNLVRFTQWGTRGEMPTVDHNPWIFIGDSFTLALQVPEEQTFVHRVGTGLGVAVVNAGVDGYSTWDETVRLAQLAPTFSPPVVVLGFFLGNDFSDNLRPHGRRTPQSPGRSPQPDLPDFPVHPSPPPVRFSPLQSWLHGHSVLFAHYLVWQKQRAIANGSDVRSGHFKDELEFFGTHAADRLDRDEPQTEAAFETLAEYSRQNHVGAVIVAVIPPAFGLNPESAADTFRAFGIDDKPDIELSFTHAMALARESGFIACDTRPELRAAIDRSEQPYFLFDAHLTGVGHQAVAAAIIRCAAALPPPQL